MVLNESVPSRMDFTPRAWRALPPVAGACADQIVLILGEPSKDCQHEWSEHLGGVIHGSFRDRIQHRAWSSYQGHLSHYAGAALYLVLPRSASA